MNNKLSTFEKKIMDYNNIVFEYPYQIKDFINKLNEFMIGYYKDSIYYFILKNKIEKRFNSKISDEQFIKYLAEIKKLDGYILFPQKDLSTVDKSYVYFLMNQALSFANKIDYKGYKYEKFLNMSKKKNIGNFIKYNHCIEAVNTLNELEQFKLSDYVVDTEQKIKLSEFDQNYQYIDFCDRLYNYYDSINDESRKNEIKEKKRKLILLNMNI